MARAASGPRAGERAPPDRLPAPPARTRRRAGIAALTAQLLVTGTQRLDAATFAETTERLGIEVGSESSWDSARAGFTALGDKLDDGARPAGGDDPQPAARRARVRAAQVGAAQRHPPGPRRSGPARRRALPARGVRRGRSLRPTLGRDAGERRAPRRRRRARLPRRGLRPGSGRPRRSPAASSRRRQRPRSRRASATGPGMAGVTAPSNRRSAAAVA